MKQTREMKQLVQQGVIVGNMMLIVTKNIHGDYRRGKHVARPFMEWLSAFVLWHKDTVRHPMTYGEVADFLNVPPSSAHRACDSLVIKELASKIDDGRYARNIEYLVTRIDSPHFKTIRRAIIDAGKALEAVFGDE